MKKRYMVATGVGLAAVVVVAGARFILHDWLTVDACYDGGGVYLEEISKCPHSQSEVDSYRPKASPVRSGPLTAHRRPSAADP